MIILDLIVVSVSMGITVIVGGGAGIIVGVRQIGVIVFIIIEVIIRVVVP